MDLNTVLSRTRGTLHLSGLRAVDVVSRDPLGVVSGGRGNCRATGSLIERCLALLGRTRRLLGEVGLSRLALLREVRRDPHGVEEVDDTSEAGQEEEVKEETVHSVSLVFYTSSQ